MVFNLYEVVPPFIDVLATLITISIVFVVVSYFVYFPVKKNIEDRQKFIKTNIDESIEKNQKADEFMDRSEKQIQTSIADSQALIEKSREEALELKKQILIDAQQEIANKKAHLDKVYKTEIANYEETFNNQVIELALEISKKAIDQKLSKQDEQALIDEFIKELEQNESNQ